MTEATSNEMIQLIEEGIRAASKSGQDVLISYIEELSEADPVQFFHNSEQRYKGSRHYWSTPGENLIVAAGQTVKLTATGSERMDDLRRQAEHLFKQKIQNNSEIEGTGPLFFSGFSFYSAIEKAYSIWKEFNAGEALMPEWILTYNPAGNAWFLTYNRMVNENDHLETLINDYQLVKTLLLSNDSENLPTPSSQVLSMHEDKVEEWLENVSQAIKKIRHGDLKKVVLSRTLTICSKENFVTLDILQRLFAYKNDSYVFLFERNNTVFLGATPERLIEKNEGQFRTMCLAGTIKRGSNPFEDEKLEKELLQDTKNLNEHHMVVDMITAEMKKVCDQVNYPSHPSILKTKSVQHLYTPVSGKADAHHHILDLVKTLHPTPAMGGVPNHSAFDLIKELETYERGWYASPVGWFDNKGEGEFVVGIRSALYHENHAVLFAGCGIVSDSKPESEREETKMKFRPMIQAMGGE